MLKKTVSDYDKLLEDLIKLPNSHGYINDDMLCEKIAKFYIGVNLFTYMKNRINTYNIGESFDFMSDIPTPVYSFYDEQMFKYLRAFTRSGFLIKLSKDREDTTFKLVSHIPESTKASDFNTAIGVKLLQRGNKLKHCFENE